MNARTKLFFHESTGSVLSRRDKRHPKLVSLFSVCHKNSTTNTQLSAYVYPISYIKRRKKHNVYDPIQCFVVWMLYRMSFNLLLSIHCAVYFMCFSLNYIFYTPCVYMQYHTTIMTLTRKPFLFVFHCTHCLDCCKMLPDEYSISESEYPCITLFTFRTFC